MRFEPELYNVLTDPREEKNLAAERPDLVKALVKLYQDNAATLTPDPVHSAFYDSHPPAALRIARLKEAL